MNKNIIASIILGISAIIATTIFVLSPKAGRYLYKENQDKDTPGILETIVFDTAKGIEYKVSIILGARTYQRTITDYTQLKPTQDRW